MRELLPTVQRLYNEIAKSREKLAKIQNSCPHPEKDCTHEFGANTGNWSPSDDCYWTNYKCYRCGKVWTADGSISRGTRVKKK